MDCCEHTSDMSAHFGRRKAQTEAQQYLKKGLPSHARALLDGVRLHEIKDATLLEVGGGVGGLHMELLKLGARQATSVEASPAYLAESQVLACRIGLGDRIHHVQADFALQPEVAPSADIVILHRVVCCYPDMPRLVTRAAEHSRRILALSFPRDEWYVRLFIETQAFGERIRGSRFRNYVHSPTAIIRTVATQGLTPTWKHFAGMWQVIIFERTI